MSKKLIGLIVALVVCCCCSVCMLSSGIGALYSCTGGSMDAGQFDQARCFNAEAIVPGKSARYVRVQGTRQDHVNVSEIIVVDDKGKNVALGKPVTASSVQDDVLPGNATSGLGRANFAITSNESESEFLEVDLGDEAMIQKVIILNRSSCCKERIKGCHIALSDKEKTEVAKSSDITDESEAYVWKPEAPEIATIKYDEVDGEMLKKTVRGQFIELRHTKKDVVINLADLKVWHAEDKDTNLAESKKVTGNSVHPAGPLARLVDGNPGNFAHTNGPADVEDHMLVDLGNEIEFNAITITNRKDCCQERAIGIQASVLNKDKQVIVRTPPIPDEKPVYTFNFTHSKFAWE